MAELSAQAAVPRTKNGRRNRRVFRSRQSKDAVQQATDAGLDLLRVLGWLVLHDVVVPGDPEQDRQAAIVDHLLAGPSGVYVVNTVTWTGPVLATDRTLTVGKLDRAEELTEVSAAADLVRAVLHGVPVAPMLCFERLEQVTGVVADVALCASENILDLLTSQPTIVDQTAFAKASRVLAAVCRPDARKSEGRKEQPEDSRRDNVTALPDASDSSVEAPDDSELLEPEMTSADELAATVASAEDIARVAAFERLMDGSEPLEPESLESVPDEASAVIHDAGAALWRDLTDTSEADDDAAVLEAELWELDVERELAEERAEATAESAAKEARDRKAREALERVQQEALRLAEQEEAELAERAARAEREAAEQAERAEQARLEAEHAEAARIRAEQAAAERAEADRLEAERIRARQVEAERLEAERVRAEQAEAERLWVQQMAADQLEAERVEAERVEAERIQAERAEAERAEAERVSAQRIRTEPGSAEPEPAELEQLHPVEWAEEQATAPAPDLDPSEDQDEDQGDDQDEIQARADRVAAIREREAQRARERAEQDAVDSRPARRRMADPDPGLRMTAPAPEQPASTTPAPRTIREVPAAKTRVHVADDESEGRPTRALFLVALGALLIAGVVIGAPRAHQLVSQVHGIFAKAPTTQVGTAVAVKATAAHPDLTVLAGTPVAARATGGFRAPKGQHLVAVPVRLTNNGLVRWDLAVNGRISVTDGSGATSAVASTVTGLRGLPQLPSRAQVAPGSAVTGYVAFAVPNGQDVRSVRLTLSRAAGDTVTWQVAP